MSARAGEVAVAILGAATDDVTAAIARGDAQGEDRAIENAQHFLDSLTREFGYDTMAIRHILSQHAEAKRRDQARAARPERRKQLAEARERYRLRHLDELAEAERARRRSPEYLAAKAAALEARQAKRAEVLKARQELKADVKSMRPRTEALVGESGAIVYHATRCPALRHKGACSCSPYAPILPFPTTLAPEFGAHTKPCLRAMSRGTACQCHSPVGLAKHARKCRVHSGDPCSCRVTHVKRCARLRGGDCTCARYAVSSGTLKPSSEAPKRSSGASGA